MYELTLIPVENSLQFVINCENAYYLETFYNFCPIELAETRTTNHINTKKNYLHFIDEQYPSAEFSFVEDCVCYSEFQIKLFPLLDDRPFYP